MTTENIKPGYYWAKDEDGQTIMFGWERYAPEFTDLTHFQIIAPVLHPDQWPTKNDLHELVKSREMGGSDFAYMEGFMDCYKLFTGRDLQ